MQVNPDRTSGRAGKSERLKTGRKTHSHPSSERRTAVGRQSEDITGRERAVMDPTTFDRPQTTGTRIPGKRYSPEKQIVARSIAMHIIAGDRISMSSV